MTSFNSIGSLLFPVGVILDHSMLDGAVDARPQGTVLTVDLPKYFVCGFIDFNPALEYVNRSEKVLYRLDSYLGHNTQSQDLSGWWCGYVLRHVV